MRASSTRNHRLSEGANRARRFVTRLGACSVVAALAAGVPATPAKPAESGLGTRFIEIKAMGDNAKWLSTSVSPDDLLGIIRHIKDSLGSKVNCLSFMGGRLSSPGLRLRNGQTIDQYLVDAAHAGCTIVPNLNLDYYNNPGGRYGAADGMTTQQNFFAISSALLSLRAIKDGPHAVILGSWPTFNRTEDQATIQSVLAQLKAQGWRYMIVGDLVVNNKFYADAGYATHLITNERVDPDVAPYLFPNPQALRLSAQEPYLQGKLVHLESQIIRGTSDIERFSNLTAAQQASALTSLASHQASNSFIEAYPVLVGNGPAVGVTMWDATRALQTNGEPFLNLILDLMKRYN